MTLTESLMACAFNRSEVLGHQGFGCAAEFLVNAAPDNGKHPTAGTTVVILRSSRGAAGDAGR